MSQYIYGYHPVIMALTDTSLIKPIRVIIVEGKYPELVRNLKANGKIPFEFTSLEKMNNGLQTTKHQGICIEIEPYHYLELEEIWNRGFKHQFGRYLICDKITDPHNFGALLRIAAGNDFDAVIVLNRNQVKITGVVAKAAAGALSVIPICEVNNLASAMNYLQQKKFWMLAAAKTTEAKEYQDLPYDFNLALIIGNEGEGVSPSVIKKADYVVAIPMSDAMESFNASVACGIICNNIYLKTINKKYP